MKRIVGMIAVMLAFIIALNVVTPAMSETIKNAFSLPSYDNSAEDDTVDVIVVIKSTYNQFLADQADTVKEVS